MPNVRRTMADPMRQLAEAFEDEPRIEERVVLPAPPVQPLVGPARPVWEPRPGGMVADEQRALRRAIAASGSGVPAEWTELEGYGCPPWWMRLAADCAWSWRLTRERGALRSRVEAFTVAHIPTSRWAETLRRDVAWELAEAPEMWTPRHSEAWEDALRDSAEASPVPFAWRESGRPLEASEGKGGAPWGWLLRARNLKWEVIAASPHKAWLRFTGPVRFADGLEEAWVSTGMARRERREERRREQEEAARRPSRAWLMTYQSRVARLRDQGVSELAAHAAVSWEAGDRWVRQPGDPNHYGYPDCRACDRDFICSMCQFADAHGSTPRGLLIPPVVWRNDFIDEGITPEEAERRERAWELQVLEAYGLLDTTEDPEAWPGLEQGQAGVGNGNGGLQGNQGPPNEGNEAQGLQIFDDVSTEDSEDDASTDFDPLEDWGAPGPVDPNWVPGN